MQLLNAEVLLPGSLAVAATNWPAGTALANVTVKLAVPWLSVAKVKEPRNCIPSPKPEGLQTGLAKSSSVKDVSGVLWRRQVRVVLTPSDRAAVRMGKGSVLLPPLTSSMPRPVLWE
jgi:hypothetical protein